MSWIPLTASVVAAREDCAAKSAAIAGLVAQQQAELESLHWVKRPFVALGYQFVCAVHYIHWYGKLAVFAVLWCIRCLLIFFGLFCFGASALFITAITFGSRIDDPQSSGPYLPTSSPTSHNSTESLRLQNQPLILAASSNEPTIAYSEPSALAIDPGTVESASEQVPGFWTEDRKRFAEDTARQLLEVGFQLLLQKYSGGPSGKVHVDGYHRQDGTYVGPYDRSYPSK